MNYLMHTETFTVTMDLSLGLFDCRRTAVDLVRSVRSEIRALQRTDPRIGAARLRLDRRRRAATVELRVAAPSAAAAFDIGTATVRASIHAAGGSTQGWSLPEPQRVAGPEVELPGFEAAKFATARPPVFIDLT